MTVIDQHQLQSRRVEPPRGCATMPVPEDVSKLVSESGNNFHAKVARWLQQDGWHVSISPYYMDQTQNKAREIDLVAEKLCPVLSNFSPVPFGYIAVRLFVECKFIPTHSVFWFTEKDTDAAKKLVCSKGGNFRADHSYTQQHHYLAHSPQVAKLFATTVGRNTDNDPYYRALNQVLNATVSLGDSPVSVPALKKGQRVRLMTTLQFPVVVCSSFRQVYGVDFYDEDSIPKKIDENFQLEIQYAYHDRSGNQKDEHLLLDFVEFNQLPAFSGAVGKDAELAAFFASVS